MAYRDVILRVFPRRLTSEGIFNNRLLFCENFCGGGQGLDGGGQIVMGDPPLLKTRHYFEVDFSFSAWTRILRFSNSKHKSRTCTCPTRSPFCPTSWSPNIQPVLSELG